MDLSAAFASARAGSRAPTGQGSSRMATPSAPHSTSRRSPSKASSAASSRTPAASCAPRCSPPGRHRARASLSTRATCCSCRARACSCTSRGRRQPLSRAVTASSHSPVRTPHWPSQCSPSRTPWNPRALAEGHALLGDLNDRRARRIDNCTARELT
eukprot:1624568-Pleurochrysis_carterae.AAC.2